VVGYVPSMRGSARKAGLHLQAFRMTMMEIATAVTPSARHHHRSR
jgi:hypothetical protein